MDWWNDVVCPAIMMLIASYALVRRKQYIELVAKWQKRAFNFTYTESDYRWSNFIVPVIASILLGASIYSLVTSLIKLV